MKYALLVQDGGNGKINGIIDNICPLLFENPILDSNPSQLLLLNDNIKKVIDLWNNECSIKDFFRYLDEQSIDFEEIEAFYLEKYQIELFHYYAVE